MQMSFIPLTLKKTVMLSSKVKHFVFTTEQSPPFDYLAGQFISIHFEANGKALKRSYSIANQPERDNLIEFAASYVANGPGTDLLFGLKPGDSINITGPFGRLILKEKKPQRYVLVATSTGVTPYRSMLKELKLRLKEDPALQVIILQGVRRQEDVLYLEDFLVFAHQFPNQVIFRTYLSCPETTNLQKHEFLGYVQHAFSDLNLNPQLDNVYLCGNPNMIDDSFNRLKEMGFEVSQIIREKYFSSLVK